MTMPLNRGWVKIPNKNMKKFFAFIIVTMVSMSAMAQDMAVDTCYTKKGEIVAFVTKDGRHIHPMMAAMLGWDLSKVKRNIDRIAEAENLASSIKLEGNIIKWRDADGKIILALPYMMAVKNGYSIK